MTQTFQLGVLGDPVAQSKSPLIHRDFGDEAGLSIRYEAIQCQPTALPQTLQRLWAEGYAGLNITVPLKADAAELCLGLSTAAKISGSVNTLIRQDEGWYGTSTDGGGLVDDLNALNIALDQRRILILGAGGAVAGICGELLSAGASRVTVMNRTYERARALCARWDDPRLLPLSNPPLDTALDTGLPYDLMIQGTSIGHAGHLPHLEAHWLRADGAIYDLNYGTAHRPMAQWADAHGFMIHDGLGMLVRQAALSFELWTGFKPNADAVLETLRAQRG